MDPMGCRFFPEVSRHLRQNRRRCMASDVVGAKISRTPGEGNLKELRLLVVYGNVVGKQGGSTKKKT